MRKTLLLGFLAFIVGVVLAATLRMLSLPEWLCFTAAAAGAGFSGAFFQHRSRALHTLRNRLQREQNSHQATRDYIQRMLDVIPMPIYVKDAQSRYVIVNRAQSEQWGRSVDELIGVNSIELASSAELAHRIRAEDAAVLGGQIVYKEEEKKRGDDQESHFRVVTKGRCAAPDGSQVIVCTMFDTTRWRKAEGELLEAVQRETMLRERTQEFVQRLIDVIPDPFYIKDAAGRYLLVNAAFSYERGIPRESLVGVPSTSTAYSPEQARSTAMEDAAVLNGTTIEKEEHFIHPPSGRERFRNIIKRRCLDIDGEPVIVVLHMNITRWKVAERELERLANEDSLTKLANRRRFTEEAERLMSRAVRHSEPLSLILLDLDHFKLVNDRFGHHAGDTVLQKLADVMLTQLRNEDLPCRWGGEEFAILLPITPADRALTLANRLREAIASTPFAIAPQVVEITVSCGLAEWRHNESIEQFMVRADKALYTAKQAGRNTCILAESPPAV